MIFICYRMVYGFVPGFQGLGDWFQSQQKKSMTSLWCWLLGSLVLTEMPLQLLQWSLINKRSRQLYLGVHSRDCKKCHCLLPQRSVTQLEQFPASQRRMIGDYQKERLPRRLVLGVLRTLQQYHNNFTQVAEQKLINIS